MILPTREEILARRARLGAPMAPRGMIALPRPKARPLDLPKLLASYRLRADFKPRAVADLAREELVSAAKEADYARVSRVIAEVCNKYDISSKELLGHGRDPHAVLPRQEAMYRARNETDLSFPEIGRCFGNRDHTTIMHAFRAHEARLAGGAYSKARRVGQPKTRRYRGEISP
jgi:hypothetical protein